MNKRGPAMKKFAYVLLLAVCLLLAACGGDMKGWPRLELGLELESFDEVLLEYHHISKHSDRMPLDADENYCGTSSDPALISEVYQQINGLPYSEKTYSKIDMEDYWSKVVVTFWKDGKAGYTFSYYEYAIKNGYFVLDDGEIHKHLGNFAHIYEMFKEKLTEAEKGA